mmetsp:Transcript_28053/g.43185  ORF Transcript_28053/g.43185 Transcript_28053/m.43185 type:complete len:167 (+) Transcript_28053:104-604(+)
MMVILAVAAAIIIAVVVKWLAHYCYYFDLFISRFHIHGCKTCQRVQAKLRQWTVRSKHANNNNSLTFCTVSQHTSFLSRFPTIQIYSQQQQHCVANLGIGGLDVHRIGSILDDVLGQLTNLQDSGDSWQQHLQQHATEIASQHEALQQLRQEEAKAKEISSMESTS